MGNFTFQHNRKLNVSIKKECDLLFHCHHSNELSFNKLIIKYDGKRIAGVRKPYYRRVTDAKISPTDPNAIPMLASGGGTAHLGYRDHYVVDVGKAKVIVGTLVTLSSIMDNTPKLDLTDWVCSRWEIQPQIAVGDAKYGTVQNSIYFSFLSPGVC